MELSKKFFDINKYGPVLLEHKSSSDKLTNFVDPSKIPNLDIPESTISSNIKSVNTEAKNSSIAIVGTNKAFMNFPVNPGSTSLTKGSTIKIGNNSIIVTDPYAMRKWQNNGHSTGIDFVTNNGQAIAVKPGKIVDVKLQGDGLIHHVSSGKKEAGYFVVVKHDDGSYAQYMHLDPMSTEDKKSLIGKELNRGDNIWGYSKGSGTMTGTKERPGVHVKFRLYGEDAHINIDPSQAIKGEQYTFIPNRHGENILK